MDAILTGVINSEKPDALKKQIVKKICDAGKNGQTVHSIRKIYQITTEWILNGTNPLQREAGWQVFAHWARHNKSTLEEFFTSDFLQHLMSKNYLHQVDAIRLINETLVILQGTPKLPLIYHIIEALSISYLTKYPCYQACSQFALLLQEYKFLIPKGEFTSKFCSTFIYTIESFPEMKDFVDQQEFMNFMSCVSNCSRLLGYIWANDNTEEKKSIEDSLTTLFRIVSYQKEEGGINVGGSTEPALPPEALASLLRHLPVSAISTAVKGIVFSKQVVDATILRTLNVLVSWLAWPTVQNLHLWVNGFLQQLASANKFTLLINFTTHNIELVFEKACQVDPKEPQVAESALLIADHMLMGFQHSPEPFHKVAIQIASAVSAWSACAAPQAPSCVSVLVLLTHSLLQLHPGYPDLYEPILEAIKDFPKPSSEEIKKSLAKKKWTSQTGSDLPLTSQFAERSATGKTGLVNLGNTCYMNSVIQALFMCDGFRRRLLTYKPHALTPICYKLQHVFAHLMLSQRAAYAPKMFLKGSRPPWFTAGHQQDCSEFLKYLLDQLHEQELNKALSSDPNAKASLSLLQAEEKSPVKGANVQYMGKLRSSRRPKSTEKESKEEATEPVNSNDDNEKLSDEATEECDAGSLEVEPSKVEVDPSLVEGVFGGKMQTTVKCLSCNYESTRSELFTDIPLAFPEGKEGTVTNQKLLAGGDGSAPSKSNGTSPKEETIGLFDLVDHYLKPERLEGDNKYFCDQCAGLEDAERTIHIVKSPDYLILTLLRFSYNIKTQSRSKILTDVAYPKTLHLPIEQKEEGVVESDQDEAALPGSDIYALCGVVIHSGTSSECGHYYFYGRHSLVVDHKQESMETDQSEELDYLQDKWYQFNDSYVSYASYNSFSNVTKKFARDTPYVLLYRKISREDSERKGVDKNESICTAEIDPPLREDLRASVLRDNAKYLQEQELEARSRANRRLPQASQSSSGWYRRDEDQGPPGSCGPGSGGGGGMGGLDTSGSRFIF